MQVAAGLGGGGKRTLGWSVHGRILGRLCVAGLWKVHLDAEPRIGCRNPCGKSIYSGKRGCGKRLCLTMRAYTVVPKNTFIFLYFSSVSPILTSCNATHISPLLIESNIIHPIHVFILSLCMAVPPRGGSVGVEWAPCSRKYQWGIHTMCHYPGCMCSCDSLYIDSERKNRWV